MLADASVVDPSLWTELFGPWGAALAVLAAWAGLATKGWMASLGRERKLYERVIDQGAELGPLIQENTRELKRLDAGRQ